MSRLTRARLGFAIGRNGLLLGTALGSAIAIMAATPNQAWAADECGADVAGVATCDNDGVPATDANPYPTGIDYVADPAEDITVILDGDVAVVTATDSGVTAVNAAGEAFVDANAGSTIDAYNDGINVYAVGGDAEVLSYATIIAEAQGIQANSFALNGDTYVFNYGDITVDGSANVSIYADGIFATSSEGVTVTNSGDISVYSSTDTFTSGIAAFAGSEDVDLFNSGAITVENTYDDGAGIIATATTSDVTIDNTAAISVLAETTATGISADAILGYVTVYSTGDVSAVSDSGDAYAIDIDAQYDVFFDIDANVDATADNIAYGIFAVSNVGGLTGSVTGDVTAVAITDDAYGIDVFADDFTTLTVIGNVTADGAVDGTGIDADASAGDVNLSVTGNVYTYGDADDSQAVQVTAYDDAYVTITGDVVSEGYDRVVGIEIDANDVADLVATGDVSAYSTGVGGLASAITVVSDGNVYVDVGGGIITAYADGEANGIQAESYFGSVLVTSGSSIDATSLAGAAYGIDARAALDVSVYQAGDIVTDAEGFTVGIYAVSGAGDILVDVVGDISATSDTSSAYAAYLIGDFDGEFSVTGDISATAGGVLAYALDINVDGDAGAYITGDVYAGGALYNTGLDVDSNLGYATTVINGDITVIGLTGSSMGISTFGDLGTSVTASGDIYVYGQYGARGIAAYGDVDTSVDAEGSIFAGSAYEAYGIYAQADDDVFVEVDADITAIGGTDGEAIHVDAGDYAFVDIDGGAIYGSDLALHVYAATASYVYNDGVLSSGGAFVIDADGGPTSIYNDGVIYGAVDLTDNADYFYNSGTWEAYGTSYFGLGVDDVTNTGTVGFSRYQGAASTTTFNGLEFFDNYGLVTGVDGQAGDSLNIDGAFFGGAGSELGLDVQLGGPGSIADTLVIGSASGVTEILPNDVLAGTPGALNFGGILVVNSANAAELGSEFVMDNVDKGFVEYSLIFDAATDNWLIVGLPDNEAFEMLAVASSSQDFWRRSGDAWAARMQEVRDAYPSGSAAAGPGGMGRSEGWELWMQAHGGSDSFENIGSFSIAGFAFGPDLTTDSEWAGLQFGFDTMSNGFIWGLTAGFVQQETRFDFDDNSFDFEGWNVGAYAGWNWGGLYLNGLVKGDFYEVDANFHTIPVMTSFDGTTWGLQGEIGYHAEFGGWFLEPHAQIAWTTTDIDGFTSFGAGFDFDNADSLYGKAGARIGGTFGSGDVVLTPYIGVYAVEEFEGENEMTFTTGPTSFIIADQARDGYGLAEFGVTAQTFYGLEAMLKGEWNFGGDAEGGAVRLGARWRW